MTTVHQIKLEFGFIPTAKNVKIHYAKTAKSDRNLWIVLLHGLGGDAAAWKEEQKYLLAAGYPSVAIDLRGHGLSSDPENINDYTLKQLSQDVQIVVNKLKLKQHVLVGHCFGGMLAMYLAAEDKFLSGLVLVETTYKPFILGSNLIPPLRLAKLVGYFGYAFHKGTALLHEDYNLYKETGDWNVARLLADIRSTSLRSYLFCCSQALSFDGEALVRKIRVATLLLAGEKDSVFPPQTMAKLYRRIIKAKLEVMSEANHIVPINNPSYLSKKIINFLKTIKEEAEANEAEFDGKTTE